MRTLREAAQAMLAWTGEPYVNESCQICGAYEDEGHADCEAAALREALLAAPAPSEPGLDALDHRYCLADECWHTDAPAPSKPGLRKAALIVARLNIPRRTTGQGVRRLVLKALDLALAAPAPSEPGLDAAWAEAEAALPEGWAVAGVTRGVAPMQFREWAADAFGPWHRSSRSRESQQGYGPTPVAALLALAARLGEDKR